jgi:hypothetical protein
MHGASEICDFMTTKQLPKLLNTSNHNAYEKKNIYRVNELPNLPVFAVFIVACNGELHDCLRHSQNRQVQGLLKLRFAASSHHSFTAITRLTPQ